MKNKKIILALAFFLVLTGCDQNKGLDNGVSEETIAEALDKDENTSPDNEKPSETDATDDDLSEDGSINFTKWRRMITEIGDFSPTLAKNLTDDQLEELIVNANNVAEQTGYWDAKDFVFQDLAKAFPELSNKFPLDSVENRYNQRAAESGEYKGMFDYERQLMIDQGYPSYDVWAIDDKTVQDAFHQAYKEDDSLYYEDYISRAAEMIFGEEANEEETDEIDEENEENTGKEPASNNKASSNNTRKNKTMKFGSSQNDYDAIKSALVQYYEFSPASVNQMTNEDIDIAYTRAMKRLEEEGFGDIGLIFEEIGKMYPGASTMYPGERSEEDEN